MIHNMMPSRSYVVTLIYIYESHRTDYYEQQFLLLKCHDHKKEICFILD